MKATAISLSRRQKEDEKFMKIALKLSLLGLGRTEPNPMVGAVVVKEGKIISTGYHRAYGQAHAEAIIPIVHIPEAHQADAALEALLELFAQVGHQISSPSFLICS